jgi:molybdopterin synthase sulfur carrier subunit
MRALVSGPSRTEGGTIMNVVVRIPTPLRAITNGRGEHRIEAATVEEAFDGLDRAYAGIKGRLCEEDGTVRRFLNVYVNEEDIRFLQGLQTPLKAGDEISIVPAMAGGR